jgi:hypothetical protein
VLLRDEAAMNKFVEDRFLFWGWSSTKDHLKDLERKRAEMRRKIDGCKKKKTKDERNKIYEEGKEEVQKGI